MAQAILGQFLDHPRDAATVYYRSRPFMISQGLTPEEALAATMGRVGSPNGGRDIGVVFNLPSRGRATGLPMSGDVGAQYTPALGLSLIHISISAPNTLAVQASGSRAQSAAVMITAGGASMPADRSSACAMGLSSDRAQARTPEPV